MMRSQLSRRRSTSKHLRPASIEPLECRIAPASFTPAGTVLTINLQAQNEAITFTTDGTTITAALTGGTVTGSGVGGVGTSTATITSATYNSIMITDGSTGNAVHFGPSGASSYGQAFMVNFSSNAGDVTFTGASTFNLLSLIHI